MHFYVWLNVKISTEVHNLFLLETRLKSNSVKVKYQNSITEANSIEVPGIEQNCFYQKLWNWASAPTTILCICCLPIKMYNIFMKYKKQLQKGNLFAGVNISWKIVIFNIRLHFLFTEKARKKCFASQPLTSPLLHKPKALQRERSMCKLAKTILWEAPVLFQFLHYNSYSTKKKNTKISIQKQFTSQNKNMYNTIVCNMQKLSVAVGNFFTLPNPIHMFTSTKTQLHH